MKTHLTNLKLPTSIWQTLHQIDDLLGQSLSWAKRLETINSILIDKLEIDAIWLLTIHPLPPTACGSMCTPLVIAPTAQVQIVDMAPPLEKGWPTSESLLGQVLNTQSPRFIEPQSSLNSQTDTDLGDVLFGTFNAIPSVIIPLIADGQSNGALIMGNYHPPNAPSSSVEETENVLRYLGKYIGTNLQNAYLVERSQRHANALETINPIKLSPIFSGIRPFNGCSN